MAVTNAAPQYAYGEPQYPQQFSASQQQYQQHPAQYQQYAPQGYQPTYPAAAQPSEEEDPMAQAQETVAQVWDVTLNVASATWNGAKTAYEVTLDFVEFAKKQDEEHRIIERTTKGATVVYENAIVVGAFVAKHAKAADEQYQISDKVIVEVRKGAAAAAELASKHSKTHLGVTCCSPQQIAQMRKMEDDIEISSVNATSPTGAGA